jgi:DNA-directed RNA polymerase beta' subunit
MMSPEEIRRHSVVEVTHIQTYYDGKPVSSGLFDIGMGVYEPNLICPTDGLNSTLTPSYFGHIELARPVYYMHFMKDIFSILKCICVNCSKLLFNKNNHQALLGLSREERWDRCNKILREGREHHRCGKYTLDGCGFIQPRFKREDMSNIYAIYGDDRILVEPEMVLSIFQRMTDDDIEFLGFSKDWSRPEWMICTVLPVCPPAVRPSVKSGSQSRSDDDLTYIYVQILKHNRDLTNRLQAYIKMGYDTSNITQTMSQTIVEKVGCDKVEGGESSNTKFKKKDVESIVVGKETGSFAATVGASNTKWTTGRFAAPSRIQSTYYGYNHHDNDTPQTKEWKRMNVLRNLIQYAIGMLANNKTKHTSPLLQRSGRKLSCISTRINSKHGRVRNNLMGKRVDQSARTVITGEPNLGVEYVGIPVVIAMNLSIPVRVNHRNIDFLTKLVSNGPDEYPGCKTIRRVNGMMIRLRVVNRERIKLQMGDIVHRHLMDGDIVLFNRQPSLHKMSMMAHKVRVMMFGNTFRFNVSDTKCYNADFDKISVENRRR